MAVPFPYVVLWTEEQLQEWPVQEGLPTPLLMHRINELRRRCASSESHRSFFADPWANTLELIELLSLCCAVASHLARIRKGLNGRLEEALTAEDCRRLARALGVSAEDGEPPAHWGEGEEDEEEEEGSSSDEDGGGGGSKPVRKWFASSNKRTGLLRRSKERPMKLWPTEAVLMLSEQTETVRGHSILLEIHVLVSRLHGFLMHMALHPPQESAAPGFRLTPGSQFALLAARVANLQHAKVLRLLRDCHNVTSGGGVVQHLPDFSQDMWRKCEKLAQSLHLLFRAREQTEHVRGLREKGDERALVRAIDEQLRCLLTGYRGLELSTQGFEGWNEDCEASDSTETRLDTGLARLGRIMAARALILVALYLCTLRRLGISSQSSAAACLLVDRSERAIGRDCLCHLLRLCQDRDNALESLLGVCDERETAFLQHMVASCRAVAAAVLAFNRRDLARSREDAEEEEKGKKKKSSRASKRKARAGGSSALDAAEEALCGVLTQAKNFVCRELVDFVSNTSTLVEEPLRANELTEHVLGVFGSIPGAPCSPAERTTLFLPHQRNRIACILGPGFSRGKEDSSSSSSAASSDESGHEGSDETPIMEDPALEEKRGMHQPWSPPGLLGGRSSLPPPPPMSRGEYRLHHQPPQQQQQQLFQPQAQAPAPPPVYYHVEGTEEGPSGSSDSSTSSESSDSGCESSGTGSSSCEEASSSSSEDGSEEEEEEGTPPSPPAMAPPPSPTARIALPPARVAPLPQPPRQMLPGPHRMAAGPRGRAAPLSSPPALTRRGEQGRPPLARPPANNAPATRGARVLRPLQRGGALLEDLYRRGGNR